MTKETKPKKPRVDKRKNVWKVAEVLAKDPNKTEREIAEEVWISNWTAHNARKELEQTWAKDPTIAYIVGSAKSRIQRVSWIFDRYIDQIEEKDKLDNRDIALAKDIVKDDMARVSVFGWDITDPNGWLKDNSLNDKQLKAVDAILSIFNKNE